MFQNEFFCIYYAINSCVPLGPVIKVLYLPRALRITTQDKQGYVARSLRQCVQTSTGCSDSTLRVRCDPKCRGDGSNKENRNNDEDQGVGRLYARVGRPVTVQPANGRGGPAAHSAACQSIWSWARDPVLSTDNIRDP